MAGAESRQFEIRRIPTPGTVTRRQFDMTAATVTRSAGAIQPSFSPQSTRCGCLISDMCRARSPLSRSRLRLKGVPSQMPSGTPMSLRGRVHRTSGQQFYCRGKWPRGIRSRWHSEDQVRKRSSDAAANRVSEERRSALSRNAVNALVESKHPHVWKLWNAMLVGIGVDQCAPK